MDDNKRKLFYIHDTQCSSLFWVNLANFTPDSLKRNCLHMLLVSEVAAKLGALKLLFVLK